MDINPGDIRIDTLIANSSAKQSGEGTKISNSAKKFLLEFLGELRADEQFRNIYTADLEKNIAEAISIKIKSRETPLTYNITPYANSSLNLRDTHNYIEEKLKNKASVDSSPGGRYLNEFFSKNIFSTRGIECVRANFLSLAAESMIITILECSEIIPSPRGDKILSLGIGISEYARINYADRIMRQIEEFDSKLAPPIKTKISQNINHNKRPRKGVIAAAKERWAKFKQVVKNPRAKPAPAAKPEKTMPPKIETEAIETKKIGIKEKFRNFWRALRGIRK